MENQGSSRKNLLIESFSDSDSDVPDLELVPPNSAKMFKPARWMRDVLNNRPKNREINVIYENALLSSHMRICLFTLMAVVLIVLSVLTFYVISLHSEINAIKESLKGSPKLAAVDTQATDQPLLLGPRSFLPSNLTLNLAGISDTDVMLLIFFFYFFPFINSELTTADKPMATVERNTAVQDNVRYRKAFPSDTSFSAVSENTGTPLLEENLRKKATMSIKNVIFR
ncbi:hypothetical protein T12_5222 [Trichinella patagoniensis]|uniref:Uncharacterized protein n=1 Tax=Trichinella patagoniensis TaxID=990121 RepID=A0A0V1A3X6_9BILA|nr:hypothetical protein T12_5222 [Trichinella patagoniensis]